MSRQHQQYLLPFDEVAQPEPGDEASEPTSRNQNSISPEDNPFHSWYRFVLSYPPHLVRDYIQDFGLTPDATILDPFCGTGTTLVEAKLNQIKSIGLEANPFPHFAATVKVDWEVDPDKLQIAAAEVAQATYMELDRQGIDDRGLMCEADVKLRALNPQAMRALIKDSISPLPLHKTLVLRDQINRHQDTPFHKYELLALGNALVNAIGNLRFGPEVGVGKLEKDTASYLQVMIRTGQLLAEIAQRLGYDLERIDLFRTRFATATQNELREEVIILHWPGPSRQDK